MGWLSIGIPINMVESVAEHSMRVNAIAFVLSEYAKIMGKEVNTGKVLEISTIHDAPEAVFMDVGGEARNIIGREKRIKYEEEGLKIAINNLPKNLKSKIKENWRELREKKTLESKIVWLADKIEMFIQAYEYMKLCANKKIFQEFIEELDKVMSEIKNDQDLAIYCGILGELKERIEKL